MTDRKTPQTTLAAFTTESVDDVDDVDDEAHDDVTARLEELEARTDALAEITDRLTDTLGRAVEQLGDEETADEPNSDDEQLPGFH